MNECLSSKFVGLLVPLLRPIPYPIEMTQEFARCWNTSGDFCAGAVSRCPTVDLAAGIPAGLRLDF
jgi:hypothetical protein